MLQQSSKIVAPPRAYLSFDLFMDPPAGKDICFLSINAVAGNPQGGARPAAFHQTASPSITADAMQGSIVPGRFAARPVRHNMTMKWQAVGAPAGGDLYVF
jgi:hypothetical protein